MISRYSDLSVKSDQGRKIQAYALRHQRAMQNVNCAFDCNVANLA